MKVLGIETSCDETAASIVDTERTIHSNVVLSQHKHRVYGGVVPEIGARAHLDSIEEVVAEAVREAGMNLEDLDGIAATCGPGLIGGVLVGAMMGKGLALSLNKPFLAINHLEGHALTPRLTNDVQYPYLLLLVSGGHCQFLIVSGFGNYELLGTTLDDAAGEAFDKVARMMGLDYPGGPKIEQYALKGDPKRFQFARPLYGRPGCDFSFSGLKTSVSRQLDQLEKPLSEQDISDVCASFQRTVAEIMINRSKAALEIATERGITSFVVSGGVAANKYIGNALQDQAAKHGFSFFAPPVSFCTDNAAMIAWAGVEKLQKGLVDDLSFPPRPRWPLSSLSTRKGDSKE